MSAPDEHLDWAGLVDYWAGDLSPAEEATHDEHLFGCEACSALSARVAELTETLRHMIPPLITPERLAKLAASGLQIVENPMQPGDRREVVFPKSADILLHRLGGLLLDNATRVSFVLRSESTNAVISAVPDAPVDRATGTMLVACQQHFAAYPADTVAEVRVHAADGGERLNVYTILHRFESSQS
jgi:anti-sigma factor RsiW